MSESERERDNLVVSDYFKVAALDMHGIIPQKIKREKNRAFFVYERQKAEPILKSYEAGSLKGSLRDYTASIHRTKTKIFELERERAPAEK